MTSVEGFSKRNAGFTLMELLISVTILSIVVILVFSAMRVSLRSWEKGESRIEAGQRLRAFVEMVTTQIEAIRIDEKYTQEGEEYYLKGDGATLSFVTTAVPDVDAVVESVHITYSVEESESSKSLSVTERAIQSTATLWENTEDPAEEIQTTVIPACYDVRFEYLKAVSAEEGQAWMETWLPVDETGLPLAVRISLQEKEPSVPVRVMVRFVLDPT